MNSSKALTVLATFIGSIVIVSSARADLHLTAQLYTLNGDLKTPLYNFKSDRVLKDGRYLVESEFTAPNGSIVATESAEITGGEAGKLSFYRLEQKQTGLSGKVEIKNGRAFFTRSVDGKTKTDDEKAGDDFLVGPTLMHYMESHWDQLLNGKTVSFRYAVIDRLESVGFEFTKKSEETSNGEKQIVIKMRPSSMIISALVDPLFFHVTQDGKHLRRLDGRTVPKQNKDGKWKDLDVTTVYQEAGGDSK